MKRNGSSYSWLSITQIRRKTKRWNKFVQGNESSSYRMWKFCSEGSFTLKVVCEWDSLILRSSIFWIFKLSRVNCVYDFPKFFSSVTSFKNIWRVDFCSSFFSSVVVKIARHLVRKHSLNKSFRKQNWRIKINSMLNKSKFSRSEESSKM